MPGTVFFNDGLSGYAPRPGGHFEDGGSTVRGVRIERARVLGLLALVKSTPELARILEAIKKGETIESVTAIFKKEGK
jgi:hypothetical protein